MNKIYYKTRDDAYEYYFKEPVANELIKKIETSVKEIAWIRYEKLDISDYNLNSVSAFHCCEDEIRLYYDGYSFVLYVNEETRDIKINGLKYADKDRSPDIVEKILEEFGYFEDDRYLDDLELDIKIEILTSRKS